MVMEAPHPRVAALTSLKILLSRHRLVEKAIAGLDGLKAAGIVGLFNGLAAMRSQAVIYEGDAMSPVLNEGPEASKADPKEVLIVRSLRHIFNEHRKFQWHFADFAAKALEEELEKNPESERLLAIRESKFMHIFRPVNPGDIVLLRNPQRGFAASEASESDPDAPPADSIRGATQAGSETVGAPSTSKVQDAQYLVRRVTAVQGQELVSSTGETHTLEPGTVWVSAENHHLKPAEALDSRTFGPLSLSHVLGRVIYRYSLFDSSPVDNSIFAKYFDEGLIRTEVPSFGPKAALLLSSLRGDEAEEAESEGGEKSENSAEEDSEKQEKPAKLTPAQEKELLKLQQNLIHCRRPIVQLSS